MRVFVTGATSLLGRSVTTRLINRGELVTCFQRHPSGLDTNEILGDIRDRGAVVAASRGSDAIIHLAALVAPRPAFTDAFAVNVEGTRNVLAATRGGRLVYVSTPSVAFHNAASVAEDAQPARYDGKDAYSRTKAIAERIVLADNDVSTVVVRPHLVWGPGDTQLVGRVIDRARAGRLVLPDRGRALIDTTYIDDAADAIIAALDRSGDEPRALGRPFVVTGNDPRPVGELIDGILAAAGITTSVRSLPAPLASMAGRLVGRWWPNEEPPLTHFAARQLSVAHWFDQSEVHEVLRWRPQVTVDEGFARLAASLDT
jgi:nucleoside-diphosphate-sugar epimerase